MSGITYFSNKAALYGDNIGCFAQKLVSISAAKYKEHLLKLGLIMQEEYRALLSYNNKTKTIEQDSGQERWLQTSSYPTNQTITNQQSGSSIPDTYLAHVDQYDQIVGSDFSSKVRVLVDATYPLSSNATKYQPILEG